MLGVSCTGGGPVGVGVGVPSPGSTGCSDGAVLDPVGPSLLDDPGSGGIRPQAVIATTSDSRTAIAAAPVDVLFFIDSFSVGPRSAGPSGHRRHDGRIAEDPWTVVHLSPHHSSS